MTLPEIAVRYLDSRVVSQIYENNVNRVAARCRIADTATVNAFLKKRLSEVASTTTRAERTIVLTLWRFAYDNELLDNPPRGVMKVKSSRSPTRAWTHEQCKTLVAGTSEVAGWLKSGAPLGLFLRTWILLGYESGSRRGDLWDMRAEHFEGSALRWTQHKTGDPIHKRLSDECIGCVNAMLRLSPDGRVLGWACKARQSMLLMKKYLISQGLPGTSKWLRRSGATHVEITQPGKARFHLGHRSLNLAAQNYIDWSQVRQHAPEVPSLVD